MEKRIVLAQETAIGAFQKALMAAFPEATSNKLGNTAAFDLADIAAQWVEDNVPAHASTVSETWIRELGLYYPEIWHLQFAGGQAVAVSDNWPVGDGYGFLSLTQKAVLICIDTFKEGSFLAEPIVIKSWYPGMSPAGLISLLEFAFDTKLNKDYLFDDIITIIKSNIF